MKIKYGELNRLFETLSRMSGLTGKEGYAIAKTKIAIRDEVSVFVELRDGLFQKYGSADGDRLIVKTDAPEYETFIKEFAELCNKEIDVNIHQIPEAEYSLDKVYCDSAQAEDYEVFDQYMVDRKDNSDKGESDGAV